MKGPRHPPNPEKTMKAIRNFFLTLVILAGIGGGAYEWWNLDVRWRPHTITKDQAEIGKILKGSGWVSPGLAGPKLYIIAYRDCDACARFEDAEFAKLHAAGVDTRVIMVARDDENGASKSTPVERSTVAELWFNRSWGLYQKWMSTPSATWAAPGIPAADGDVARSAVVEVGRDSVERLTPLLKDNGVDFAYPTLVWWTKDGTMQGCACDDVKTYASVLKGLGVG